MAVVTLDVSAELGPRSWVLLKIMMLGNIVPGSEIVGATSVEAGSIIVALDVFLPR